MPLSGCGFVQVGGIDVRPSSRIQAVDELLNSSDGFRRGESAVSGAKDKSAPQEFAVTRFIDNVLVGAFILNHHQPIALGMQSQHGNVDFAVKDNISLEVVNGYGISADSGGLIERFQIGVEIEASLLVKCANLVAANGAVQLSAVIDPRVPGNVALGAKLKLRAKRKSEWKVHLLVPQELVCLLAGKIGRRRLG